MLELYLSKVALVRDFQHTVSAVLTLATRSMEPVTFSLPKKKKKRNSMSNHRGMMSISIALDI